MTDNGHNEDFADAYELITLLTDEEYLLDYIDIKEPDDYNERDVENGFDDIRNNEK